ncbi:hypothetical protein PPERSA_09864 [Pseudocohnilembus persalinus]|uniref:LsmAD domain-containing protein n=1 Tax=Pseudocohnilembus persalinus TaxID=266149 RepID=A0A0V0QTR5_PSEPJ|nr:hypothetical protein PPERSA_09864 [Pseudocohnilembus persalinus]|eukprot:KRX05724.1 hypothetical protein PPERSA_09864 [Pseudocohnilembus persalinus]
MQQDIEQILSDQNIKDVYNKRFNDAIMNSLGKKCQVKLNDGSQTEGNLYTMHPQNFGIALHSEKNSDSSQIIINKEDFVYMLISDLEQPPYIQDKSKTVIKTDRQLGRKQKGGERVLQQQWDFEDDNEHGGLEDGLDNFKAKGDFDQFKANKDKFDIEIEYDEHQYTSKLDETNHNLEVKKRAMEEEQNLLKEKGKLSKHQQEDRNLINYGDDYDEEGAYSAVLQSGRYQDKKVEEDANKKQINFSKGPLRFTSSKNKAKENETQQKQVPQEETQKKSENSNSMTSINKNDQSIDSSTSKKKSKLDIKSRSFNFDSDLSLNQPQNQQQQSQNTENTNQAQQSQLQQQQQMKQNEEFQQQQQAKQDQFDASLFLNQGVGLKMKNKKSKQNQGQSGYNKN